MKLVTRHAGIPFAWKIAFAGIALAILLLVAAGQTPRAEATTTARDTKANREQILKSARSFIGVKYVSGEPEPCSRESGVDCECLNRLVYRRFGINLPSTPEDQFHTGQRRSLERLRPGDLVFFSEDHSGNITHTGIYAGKDESGERMIIHASTYWHEVVEKPMSYVEGYAGGRDVLP